jgi:AcrR family transcriptional regulator
LGSIALSPARACEATTVEEICDAANVGRSTFYAHYTSKDDLHQRGIENLRKVLADRRAQGRKDLFRALAGSRGGAVALATIRQIIADAVRDELAATGRKNSTDTMPREFIVQYIVGACMAVLTSWLDKGAKLPADRIDAMFRRLATEGIMPSKFGRQIN